MKSIILFAPSGTDTKNSLTYSYYKHKEIIAEPVQNSEKSLASTAFEEAMIVLAVVQMLPQHYLVCW